MKENHVWFYQKHPRRYRETSLKHSIVLPNHNFLEQKFENFKGDEMDNKEPLDSDNNGEEEEQKI